VAGRPKIVHTDILGCGSFVSMNAAYTPKRANGAYPRAKPTYSKNANGQAYLPKGKVLARKEKEGLCPEHVGTTLPVPS